MSKFLNSDCMLYLPLYPDDYFDLAIVDPPYGIGIGHKSHMGGLSHSQVGALVDSGDQKLITMIGGGVFRNMA